MSNHWVDGQMAVGNGKFLLWDLPDRWETVMPAADARDFKKYPVELRYVLALQPSRIKRFHDLLDRGCGLGVRCRHAAGLQAAPAVKRLTVLQDGAMLPWVERCFVRGQYPNLDDRMHEAANERGWDPQGDMELLDKTIKTQRQFVLLQAQEGKTLDEDLVFLDELNGDLHQASVHLLVNATAHAAGPRPEPSVWTLAAAVFVLGPVLHVVGWAAPWISLMLGATVLSFGWEIWRIWQHYRYGAATWQAKRQAAKFLPGAIFSLGCAVLSSVVFDASPVVGALLFGLAATSTHWARLIRALAVQKALYDRLARAGKLDASQRTMWFRDALASSGSVWTLAALLSVVLSGLALGIWPQLLPNGWVLAGLAASPWLFYDTGSVLRLYGSDWLFRRRLERLLKRSVLLVA